MDMGKMVGPLPMGAWVGVTAAGLAFAMYQRKQKDVATTDAVAAANTSPQNGVGDGTVGGWTPTSPTDSTGSGIAPTKPETNDQWGANAENWLIAQGYNPAVADSAIRKYLDQESGYSAQEFTLVTLALGHFGATPELLPAPVFGKPPVPVTPRPKPKPTTHPVQHPGGGGGRRKPPPHKPHVRYYTVQHGDTLSSIARRYHGVSWQEIYNANRAGKRREDKTHGMIHNPNMIQSGWRIIIPA